VAASRQTIVTTEGPIYRDRFEIRTKLSDASNPLQRDGTAEEWHFLFYSSSEKSTIGINITKQKRTKEIRGEIVIKEPILVKEEERAGEILRLSEEEIQQNIEKEIKRRQRHNEGAIFNLSDWKIDSTELVDIASKEFDKFSPGRLILERQADGTLVWIADSAKLEKGEGGEMWVWRTIAEINATSGEIIKKE